MRKMLILHYFLIGCFAVMDKTLLNALNKKMNSALKDKNGDFSAPGFESPNSTVKCLCKLVMKSITNLFF